LIDNEKIIQDLNTHHWMPQKEKTGILLIDLQEYFRGIIDPILDNLNRIIQAARQAGVPLFFTQHGHGIGHSRAVVVGPDHQRE